MKVIHCYFDETEFDINDVTYLGLAGVFIEGNEVNNIEASLIELKDTIDVDQYTGRKEDSRTFHFTEDNMAIKPKIIDCIRDKNFRSYIAFTELKDTYSQTYISILEKILNDRIEEKHDYEFKIYYEQNDKLKSSHLNNRIDEMITRLKAKFSHIQTPTLEKVTKEEILSSVPDYILGVFRDYIKDKRLPYMVYHFEQLRNKIRLIVDMEKGIYYSRSNPFIIN